MQNVRAIFSKEFGTYFNSATAYIAIMIFLMVTSYLFFFPQGFYVVSQASLRPFFSLLPWTLLLFIPAVTMRLWAEEKKMGTIEVLMTLPVKDWEVVIGKFLAALGFYVIMLGLTLTLPLTVAALGDPDTGTIVGGYVGALLLGAAFIAIGSFISSLTSEQIVAFIVTVVALLAGLRVLSRARPQDAALHAVESPRAEDRVATREERSSALPDGRFRTIPMRTVQRGITRGSGRPFSPGCRRNRSSRRGLPCVGRDLRESGSRAGRGRLRSKPCPPPSPIDE